MQQHSQSTLSLRWCMASKATAQAHVAAGFLFELADPSVSSARVRISTAALSNSSVLCSVELLALSATRWAARSAPLVQNRCVPPIDPVQSSVLLPGMGSISMLLALPFSCKPARHLHPAIALLKLHQNESVGAIHHHCDHLTIHRVLLLRSLTDRSQQRHVILLYGF